MNNDEFQSLVKTVAEQGDPSILPNSSAERASIVLEEMFDRAKDKIYLVVKNLDSNITKQPNYNESLKRAIERNLDVEILYTGSPNQESETNKLLDRLKKQNTYKLKTYMLSEAGRKVLYNPDLNNNQEYFFSICDKQMFRFEYDDKNHKAWFCFNDKARVDFLSNLFSRVISISTTV